MTSLMVAQRYAQALYQEAVQTASIIDDVTLIQETLLCSAELEQVLKSPVIPRQKKSAVLQSLFAKHVQSKTMQFLQMLVQRGRESLLAPILTRFLSLSDEAQGITTVQARVHSQLSSDEEMRLQNVLGSRLGCSVRLDVSVDPALMGGIVLKIGDMVYDGSVRHQLSLLQDRLHIQA